MWSDKQEQEVMDRRNNGQTYKSIALSMGRTISSIKHKVRRIQQDSNEDRYKHTSEKSEQIAMFMPLSSPGYSLGILETHCGFGGLTELYNHYGVVTSCDISEKRINHIVSRFFNNVTAVKVDSEKDLKRMIYHKHKYDVIDIDPYGFPSRFFPGVFELMDDGVLFLTFPMMGVAQINKITIKHYQAFWGIELSDKREYIEKITEKLKHYGFMCGRDIEILDVLKIDRIYRFAIKVQKKSLCDIVGLVVNRAKNENT